MRGCVIEVFLDGHDTVTETLESLSTTTADGDIGTSPESHAGAHRAPHRQHHRRRRAVATPAYDHLQRGDDDAHFRHLHAAHAPTPRRSPVPQPPLPVTWPTYVAQPTAPGAPNLVITVTTTADPDDSEIYVCYNAAYPGVVGKTNRLPCTLRQAIEEAESVIAVNSAVRPVEIRFNIPTSDPGYDAGLGVWVIQITDTTKLYALPALGSTDVNKAGQVIIDGGTQPGGRSSGPKIVVRGPQNRDLDGLVVNGNNNVIRRLAFQKFSVALQLNHSQNIVENNWFGLDVATECTGATPSRRKAAADRRQVAGTPPDGSSAATLLP